MIQLKYANNSLYNTDNLSLELKNYFEQIAVTQNLRDQLVAQIYIIIDIQKAINDNSIQDSLDKFLLRYNDSIARINEAIVSVDEKLGYFDIQNEKSSYERQKFTMKLASKCKEVEMVFDKIVLLNAQAINKAKKYISNKTRIIDYSQNVDINNMVLANVK
jgi:hypothetical protein